MHVTRDSSVRRGLQSIKSEVLQTPQLNQGEPEEWVTHFKRRQLLQAGSATGGIVAISPSVRSACPFHPNKLSRFIVCANLHCLYHVIASGVFC